MDYEALAKKYGGVAVKNEPPAQAGGYDALIKQYGGTVVSPEIPVPTSEPPRGPEQPSFMTSLGRGVASLADTTVGAVLPALVQQVGYPLARMGRSPEEAQAATQRIAGAVEQPFGKAFGVTQTPEYQQETSRQVMAFIAENVQKGAKWLSEKTGLPVSDVENMIGSATIAASPAIKPVAKGVKKVVSAGAEQVATAAKMPFEKQIQARRERQSLEDYTRGPQIDAAEQAQRLGIALNPTDIENSVGAKLSSAFAGDKGARAISENNKYRIREIQLNEMGLAPDTQLNSQAPFDKARSLVAGPYDEVKKLPKMVADNALVERLESLRPDQNVIGAKEYAAVINPIIDDAIATTQAGLTGEQLLQNVRVLRERARKTYNNKGATIEALDIADTNMAIANSLESMIESNIFNPKLLSRFRDAREKMARVYAYEAATDLNTGVLDVKKLARITSKDNRLTGDIAALGQIAGNFPDAFTTTVASPWYSSTVRRTGVLGTLGGVGGYALSHDPVTAAAGSLALPSMGLIGQNLAARRIASPEYQAGLKLQDRRIPVQETPPEIPPTPQNRAVVPYQAPVEVLMPGEGPYRPNFVLQPNQYPPQVSTVPPQTNRLLGAPSAEGTLNALRTEDTRRAAMSRSLGQQAEAQQAAAEAAARRPTSGELIYDLDPITGRLRESSQGLRGATPETFRNFGESLDSAAQKITAGKNFDLTAAEKVMWDRTRVDMAEIAPGFKSLTDKAIAEKMMDRKWVEGAVQKAQEKARLFDQLAAKATEERARQQMMMQRERMLDLAEQLQDSLAAPRPVSRGGQGPKTREAKRNALSPGNDVQNLNKLLEP